MLPVTDTDRELLAKATWTHDELLTIAFLARRLVAELERAPAPHGGAPVDGSAP